MFAAMRTYILSQRRPADPEDALSLMRTMWDDHRIQVASSVFQGHFQIRLSAQIYVHRTDFERAVDVLQRTGWPGR
jgi:hypothetical protein